MAAAESDDETSGVVMVLEGVGSELQAGDPTFGANLKADTVLRGEGKSHDLGEEGGGFLGGEAQVGGAEFEQGPLAAQAGGGEGERGVLAGGKDKMKLRRKMLQQKGQGRMNGLSSNDMIIFQDKNGALLARASAVQFVDQHCQHGFP